jgi:hypothetical protein
MKRPGGFLESFLIPTDKCHGMGFFGDAEVFL